MQNRKDNAIKVDRRELEMARHASLVAFQIDVALLEGTADEPVDCFGMRAELAVAADAPLASDRVHAAERPNVGQEKRKWVDE